MNTVLVLAFSDLARDPRVNRQLRFLREDYRVIAAGTGDPELEGVRYVPIAPPPPGTLRQRARSRALGLVGLALHRHERVYWAAPWIHATVDALRGVARQADLLLCNDVDTLPVSLALAPTKPVVFDAHEYEPREREDSLRWRILFAPYRRYLCERYIPRTAAMLTVCASIAEAYAADTGVQPTVITNAPDYEPELRPSRAGATGSLRLVHHGRAMPERKLETLVDTMAHLDGRFELSLVLVEHPGHADYIASLRRRAGDDPRIRFLPAVPMRELPRFLNAFDLGVYLLDPSNFNQRYALPNKFFEFIQARLGVALGPSPEMARVVREHGCGRVADDFRPESLAALLRDLDRPAVDRLKQAAHAAARELSAERNRERLLEVVRRALLQE